MRRAVEIGDKIYSCPSGRLQLSSRVSLVSCYIVRAQQIKGVPMKALMLWMGSRAFLSADPVFCSSHEGSTRILSSCLSSHQFVFFICLPLLSKAHHQLLAASQSVFTWLRINTTAMYR